MSVVYDTAPAEVNVKSATPATRKPPPDGKVAPAVFPTGGDLQTGSPTYSGAPQQGQGTSAPTAAPAPQAPTFRTLQMAGQARPAPPAPAPMGTINTPPVPVSNRDENGNPIPGPVPGFPGGVPPLPGTGGAAPQPTPAAAPAQGQPQFGGSAISGSLQQLLQQMFANPTAYDDDVIQAQRQAGMGRLDQEGAMAKARLDEEMAGRGLFSSTIAQGRLGDIDINRQNAMADMESRFLGDRARATDEGRRAAAGLGMEFDRMAFDQQAEGQRLGLQRDDLAFRREDSQANRDQRGSEFDRSYGLDRDRFGEDTRQFDSEQARRGSEFDRSYGLDRDRFGEDQRQFDEDLGMRREDLGLRRDMFGEDTRRYDQDFGANRDDEDWNRNLDFYDMYNNSDLLDLTGYNNPVLSQSPPPPPDTTGLSAMDAFKAMRSYRDRYGSEALG